MTYTRLWLLLIRLPCLYLCYCMLADEGEVEVLVRLWKGLWPPAMSNAAKLKHSYSPSELQAKRLQ